MKIVKYLFAIISILSMTSATANEVSKAGTTAAGFLNVGVGARAVGMGGAFVALANDATTMYWNPAGISLFTQPMATFSHTRWIADINFNYTGFALPLDQFGTIGINATFLSTDPMERTTVYSPTGTGEMFDVGSYAFAFSYAASLTDRFSIGFNAKYIQEKIYHSTASGAAFDIGTLYITRLNGMKIGMSISNYGTKMQMAGQDLLVQTDVDKSVSGNNPNINAHLATDKSDLPLMFRVGVSMDVLKGRSDSNLNVSVDALHPNDDVESLNLGAEYVYRNMFALRGGYRSLFARDSEEGLALGAGLMYKLGGSMELKLDYAFQDFGVLNDIQMFTFALAF